MNRSIWLKKIKYIEGLKDEELVRMESYSVLVSFILSKEEFKINAELKEFMEELGIECKLYLLKSRTAMLARAVRIFQKADITDVRKFIDKIKNRIKSEEHEQSDNTTKKSKENYMKKVLNLYGRVEENEEIHKFP